DQTADAEMPIRKAIFSKALVVGVAWLGGSIGAELGGKIGLGVFACERGSGCHGPLHKARDRFGAFKQLGEVEVVRNSVPAAQYRAADTAGHAGEKAASPQSRKISHVLLQCRTSR